MGMFPKLLFALMLLLPGGFVVGPVVLLLKRWHDRRAPHAEQPQLSPVAAVLSAELPRDPHPIEPQRAAA